MLSLHAVLPDVADSETRSLTSLKEYDGCPAGTYIFTEFYCEDLSCNCNRVMIKVYRTRPFDANDPGEEVATISYAMSDSKDSYWNTVAEDMENPFQDTFHKQASYADEVMYMWLAQCEADPDYHDRLSRHHKAFRRELKKNPHILNGIESMEKREAKAKRLPSVPKPFSRKEMKQRDRQRQKFVQLQRGSR